MKEIESGMRCLWRWIRMAEMEIFRYDAVTKPVE